MKEHTVRIPEDIYKRFKHICIDKDLSVPKQVSALLLSFVETQEINKLRLDESRKYNQQRNKQ